MPNQNNKKESDYARLTGVRRAIPIILAALAVFTGLCFVMQETGAFGRIVTNVFLGLFSIGGYFIPAFLLIHAVFYASDHNKKRTATRVVFTLLALITISVLTHCVTHFDEKHFEFSASGFYKDGAAVKGGGFVGGVVAFALNEIFGKVGIIIIAVLMFALYITYFFTGGKNKLAKILLVILTAISNFFNFIGDRAKGGKKRRAKRREDKLREELAEKQDELTDDDFFISDNGMRELKISNLGIEEKRNDSECERVPHLQNKVHHKSADTCESTRSFGEEYAREIYEAPEKRRAFNLEYGTTDSIHDLSSSVEDSYYEKRDDDIIYDVPRATPVSESADDAFSGDFEPFDFKLNQELANKRSSRTATPEPEGITEIAEPITELDPEAIEKARQRADFEMKKRATLEAQKRYAEARAEIARNKAAAEEAARIAAEKQFSIPYYSDGYSVSKSDAAEERNPYIPDYMQTSRESEIITESPAATEEAADTEARYRHAASFASAMSDYEKERTDNTFKSYAHPEAEQPTSAPTPEVEEGLEDNELKITRTMLNPTPNRTPSPAVEEICEASLNFEDDSTKLDFEENDAAEAAEMDFGIPEEDEEYADTSITEEIPEDELADPAVEIPESERNADVIEQRKMFSFLNEEDEAKKEEEERIAASAPRAEQDSLANSADITKEVKEDEPPFEFASVNKFRSLLENQPKPAPAKEETPAVAEEKPDYSDYQFPPIDLLIKGKVEEDANQDEEKNQNADKLVDALQQFNVRISIKGVDRGPRITRYEIVPARGVKVQSVIGRFDDIALNLGVDGMRMEAPIPGKSAIGVEIPNRHPSIVLLRDLVESDEFSRAEAKTTACLGKDVTGNPVFADIGKMPHALVAGATGMGKSVCINAILISILYRARPDEVKFIMIDPKKVEFNGYNGIPHLLIPVVTDVKQAAGALMWAVEQMEKRYDIMEKLEVKKIDSYNEKVRENPELGEPLPKIIIVIDELNDIMLQVRKPAEDLIMSIAQKARAAGIHLIIGTQRPSVDVITGVIKANIPTRISCKVASVNDSRTILEQGGAEKLLNNGDMLYVEAGKPKALRVQGAFVSDGEVTAVMKFLKSQAKGSIYDAQALEEINRAAQKCSKGKGGGDDLDDGGDEDDTIAYLRDRQFLDAVDLAIKSGKIATSLIQRRLSVGYSKAAKFIDGMEELGIVSEPNGQKPRDVLITKDEWHELLARRSVD